MNELLMSRNKMEKFWLLESLQMSFHFELKIISVLTVQPLVLAFRNLTDALLAPNPDESSTVKYSGLGSGTYLSYVLCYL